MPHSFEAVQVAEAARTIAVLRQKLLDLSNRNRLLNFNHSPRASGHIRVIDEIPAFLFERMNKGKRFDFEALPKQNEAQNIPKDEETDEFKIALEDARSTNEEYNKQLGQLEEQHSEDKDSEVYQDAHVRLERWLRDLVRVDRGMPTLKSIMAESLPKWAKRNEIDPSFELPEPSSVDTRPERSNHYLQTLHLPDEMNMKLGKIFEIANQAINEKGVNTLYVAFGFIEWFESDTSDKSLFAPLILVPIQIEKEVKRGEMAYSITATGDDPQKNITLAARIKQDFGLVLPEIQDGEDFEGYIAQVTEVIGTKNRWRIHRYVTVGHFAFARLVMYNDLDEQKWPSDKKPSSHVVAKEVFGGRNAGGNAGFREIYNPDDRQYKDSAPSLVVDADSSQFSAVVDVVNGKNLVIQGPPGTGKSQTITNIIAAAIEQGKTVLFVAEKMAALNVVKGRLENAGIGEFCLELHSTKATKLSVMAAFKRCLEMRSREPRSVPPQLLAELNSAKEQLKEYLDLLKQELGETGLKINQILWRSHSKSGSVLPEEFRRVAIDDVETWSAEKISRIEQYFINLNEAENGLCGSPQDCPWNFIRSPNLTPIDFPIIDSLITSLIKLSVEIDELLAGLGSSPVSRNFKVAKTLIAYLPEFQLPDSPEDQAVFEILSNKRDVIEINTYHEIQAQIKCFARELNRWFLPEFIPAKEKIQKLKELALGARLLTAQDIRQISDLALRAEEMTTLADRIDNAMDLLARVCRAIRVPIPERNATAIDALLDLARLVTDTKDEILLDRSKHRLDPEANEGLIEIEAELNQLQAEAARLTQQLVFDPNTIDGSTVKLHKDALLVHGIFRFFRADYREAKKFVRSLYAQNGLPSDGHIRITLENIEAFASKRDEFYNKSNVKTLLWSIANGMNFDIERLRRIIIWGQKIRRIYEVRSVFGIAITKFLFEASADEIRSAKEFFTPEIVSQLERLANESRTHLDKIDTAPSELRGQAGDCKKLIFIADESALSRACLFDDLPLAEKSCQAMIEANDRLIGQRENIRKIFGEEEISIILERVDRVGRLRSKINQWHLPKEMIAAFLSKGGIQRLSRAREGAIALDKTMAGFAENAEKLAAVAQSDKLNWQLIPFEESRASFVRAQSSLPMLPHWCSWLRACNALREEGGDSLLQLLAGGMPAKVICDHLKHVISHSMARRAHEIFPRLRSFTGVTLSDAQRRVRFIDAKLKEFARAKVFSKAFDRGMLAPAGNGVGSVKTYTELALIRHQTSLQRPSLAIRDFLSRAGTAAQALMPCFMMSPMSVAQFLKNDGVKFDIVIFDEASQVLPEDAIGAIVRGDRLVVVGDQMQLPPTDFFQKAETGSIDDMDEEEAAAIQGMESILDKALSVFQPRRLLWHYRSRDPRLIAFSNREFYENTLQIFPAPHTKHPQLGIKFIEVGGAYAGRCNPIEAEAIAEAAIKFMREYPKRSLGVVALNSQQRDIIEAKVDRLIASDLKATKYCHDWKDTLEPFFVKNLENVQGDERDVIFISTVFGKDSEGNIYQRFGPLNSAVGHRRLNVLFTRAKESIEIYTSLRPEDIQIEEGSSWGRRVFRNYLEYARSGRLEAGNRSDREPDSDFEVIVRERLRVVGYEVDCQVGVSGYFVDLGVRHPKHSANYLLGVECDGASYHSFKSARDRDRLRQEILERLGWHIHRIWSTDWFQNPEREMTRLVEAIQIRERAFSANFGHEKLEVAALTTSTPEAIP